MKELHILNGDAIKPLFDRSGLEGEIVIWREVMVEGPIEGDIRSDDFWNQRRRYVEGMYGGNYKIKVLSRLQALHHLSAYGAITLWFEYDLFCQANMLAALALIDHEHISLVCLGDELSGNLQGLGQIRPEDYPVLYGKRAALSNDDANYARSAWKAYQKRTMESLEPFFADHTTFKYLGRALQSAKQLVPDESGLNSLQRKMRQLQNEGLNDRQIIGKMLRDQTWLGLGDLQYERMLGEIAG